MANFISATVTGDNALALALGRAIANPSKSRAYLKKAAYSFSSARGYALGSTGKFFREKLRAAFVNNPFGWKENAMAQTASGIASIKAIVAGNKPKIGRKRISKPKKRVLGGRLRNAMLSKAEDDKGTLEVGTILKKVGKGKMNTGGWQEAFMGFQTAHKPIFGGNSASMHRYMWGIGIPWSRNAPRVSPARPLIDPMVRLHPPADKYHERFTKKLLG